MEHCLVNQRDCHLGKHWGIQMGSNLEHCLVSH